MVDERRPIRISTVSVRNLGPIPEIHASLADLNIFYGPNESGKTFLVEFIIQSLFSKTTYWAPLRQLAAQGMVVVEGLDRSPVEFPLNQRGKPKLDELLERRSTGLTVPLARVLVVRAADVSIGGDGLSKDAIKEVFLRKRFFETLRGRISRVVQKATLTEEGLIYINRQGEGKQRAEYMEKLQNLNNFIDRIQREFQVSELMELKIQREGVVRKIEQQQRAKRYEAYRISQEMENLKAELAGMPRLDEIEHVKERLSLYHKNQRQLREIQRQLKALEPSLSRLGELQEQIHQQVMAKRHLAYRVSKQIDLLEEQIQAMPEKDLRDLDITIREYQTEKGRYETLKSQREKIEGELSQLLWVPEAALRYQEILNNPPIQMPSLAVPLLSLAFLLASVAGFLLDEKVLGGVMLLPFLLSFGYYLWRLNRALRDSPKMRELQVLEERFRKALDREAVVLSDIEELKRRVTEKETLLKGIDLESLKVSLESKSKTIGMLFEKLGAEVYPEDQWTKALQGLYEQRARLHSEIQSKREFLSSLQVKPTEYFSEDPGIEFDEDTFQRLQQEVEGLRDRAIRHEQLREQWQALKETIEEDRRELSEIFTKFTGRKVEEEQWETTLRTLADRVREVEGLIGRLEGKLKGLEVPPEEYITEEPEARYNSQLLNDLRAEEGRIQELISEKERALEGLRSAVVQITGADYSSEWNTLIDALYDKRQEVLKDLRELNARIVAGVLITQHLQAMQEEEDRQIEGLLNSREFLDHLWSITKRYRGIQIKDEGFEIKDDFGVFPFSALSTGAQEQVLLALRLGMATRLSGHDRMFMILDDAFQHVDWQKRPALVQALVEMAKDGWQVIYLTMDDHIRDLFHKQARTLGDRYKFFDLKVLTEDQRRLFY
ncbi:MAG: hypothetical protein D6778_00365 [Nitrospirae bacterium]|nr:MAG: hypothetical protein D6778_00365 [Nitrospirota bacterium]